MYVQQCDVATLSNLLKMVHMTEKRKKSLTELQLITANWKVLVQRGAFTVLIAPVVHHSRLECDD